MIINGVVNMANMSIQMPNMNKANITSVNGFIFVLTNYDDMNDISKLL
jgi:hypothetical protein